MKTKLERIQDLISDSVTDLLYYDRKEDSDLPPGEIERMVKAGEISAEEIIGQYRKHLTEAFK